MAIQHQQTGEMIILVINQGLWFKDSLENFLLNPNQLLHHETGVFDNPFYPDGIYIEADDTSILLATRGTTLFFDLRTPMQQELETCRHIHLTLEQK